MTIVAPRSILFACQRNSIRSPMAEGLMRRAHRERCFIASAGVIPEPLDPFALEAMAEIGIDISDHAPADMSLWKDADLDLIVSLAPEAHHVALEIIGVGRGEAERWPTPDPSDIEGSRDAVMDAYRDVRDGLDRAIRRRFQYDGRRGVGGAA